MSLRLEGEETLKYYCDCQYPCRKVEYSWKRPWMHTRVIFPYLTRNTLYRQIWLKNNNKKTASVSWNLVTRTIWICRIQWLCSLFPFFPFLTFWVKLSLKNQNCQFELKFGNKTNVNMQNKMALFTFSVLDGKHPFRGNLVQKIKIFSLSWNLVPRLIQICRIKWHCSLFLF